ncbi:Uncharacterized protein APZ42_004047, partial [Daphnia magna]
SLFLSPYSAECQHGIRFIFIALPCQLTWIGFNTISIFRTANVHLPSVQHCRFDNFGSFAPSGPHATTFLRFPVVVVYAFPSSRSSSTSSPHHCLRRRLCLHLRLAVVLAVFIYAITSSSASS